MQKKRNYNAPNRQQVNERKGAIYKLIYNSGFKQLTVKRIKQELKLNDFEASVALRALIKDNLLTVEQVDRRRLYKLVETC